MQQAGNKTNNKWLEHNGLKMIQEDWARHLECSSVQIQKKLSNGIDFKFIVEHFTNVKQKKYRNK